LKAGNTACFFYFIGVFMNRRSLVVRALFFAAAAMPGMHAFSADAKPIRIIVPFAPGGTTDIIARLIAVPLSARLGQPVIVENRPGAGGSIGTAEVARAAPDGLTLGIATVSGLATNPVTSKVGYDPLTDFTPITNIAATPNVIAVHPSFPARDFATFLKVLKANPGKYSYATSGAGSVGNLQMELLKQLTNTKIVHIPYTGAGPALQGVVSGQGPEIIFDQFPSIRTQIFAGKLIPIAIASTKRLPMPLDMPTLAELGFEQANRSAFYGLVGPAGMSKEAVKKLSDAMESVLMTDFSTRLKIVDTGSVVVGNTPAQFKDQLKSEFDVYAKLVKSLTLKIDN
jgi:tripartite-type tricarboxylate transporter receptor subunit TctC